MAAPVSFLEKYHVYPIVSAIYIVAFLNIFYGACKKAYDVRMYAIEDYGRVIHEFDPYFNYRAAEYLWQHGWREFFQWFDYMSWYPLGRPVGTTIFPGMQFTSVWIKQFLLPNWSINDICCFVPSWFGVLATMATAALCYITVDSIRGTGPGAETKSILLDIPIVSAIVRRVVIPILQAFQRLLKTITRGSTLGMPTLKNPPALESSVFAACIMSIVPAHLMRSVGGGYDNESVATTAMQLTFLGWAWALTADNVLNNMLRGILAGIAYFYMVAAWGGYVFVINLVGIHAVFVFLLRKLPYDNLYAAYTGFYVVGTFLAMQVPVVNWQPLKSLEQLGPFFVFAGFQIIQVMKQMEAKYRDVNKWKVRAVVVLAALVVAIPVVYFLYTVGYFGPISSRVRGLFVKHTKTGNPLVDSVAEHQAASPQAYYQYLHAVCFIAPIGFVIIALIGCTACSSFLLMYGVTTYFFSHRMVRLVLLTAPIASICGGIALGYGWAWAMSAVFGDARPSLSNLLLEDEGEGEPSGKPDKNEQVEKEETPPPSQKGEGSKKNKKQSKKKMTAKATLVTKEEEKDSVVVQVEPDASANGSDNNENEKKNVSTEPGEPFIFRAIRLVIAVWAIQQIIPSTKEFEAVCEEMARAISHPTIITKGVNKHTGEEVVVDDYRQAYFWLRDNTPEDARIMAWWDYGYQITGIANRTTIADGNTWNHEHIALLGRILTAPEKEAHRIARHMADYVLIWAGGGGDDVAKSPHLLRIANSVYRGLCSEPTCRSFGMARGGQPSKQLAESLLYKLHSNGIVPGVEADRNRFREVFSSKYGKVRIYKILSVSKESKEWVEKNRKCDAPGSWYCPGQYPPALTKILKDKKDFKQLEDFNVKEGRDEEYQKQYFENLNKKDARKKAAQQIDANKNDRRKPASKASKFSKLTWDQIELLNEDWENNEQTHIMWEVISQGQWQEFVGLLQEFPELAHVRSEDGRGPMWWAHEYGRPRMVDVLNQLGVSDQRTDANGIRPMDISKLPR